MVFKIKQNMVFWFFILFLISFFLWQRSLLIRCLKYFCKTFFHFCHAVNKATTWFKIYAASIDDLSVHCKWHKFYRKLFNFWMIFQHISPNLAEILNLTLIYVLQRVWYFGILEKVIWRHNDFIIYFHISSWSQW